MKNLLNLFILISGLNFCSVTPDFKFADLEEQIDYAGAIIQGTVTAVSNQFNAVVSLNNLKYYRGCQSGSTVQIARFVQSATCGNGIPKIGDQIIAFACEASEDGANLKINQFIPYTGWVQSNAQNIQKIQQRTGNNGTQNCNCRRGIEKCLNRDTADKCASLLLPPNLTETVGPQQTQDPIYGRTIPELQDFPLNLTGTTRPREMQDPVYGRNVPEIQRPGNNRQNRLQIQQPIVQGRPVGQRQAPIFEIRMPQTQPIPIIPNINQFEQFNIYQ